MKPQRGQIQRVQTIYLVLALISLAIEFFTPVITYKTMDIKERDYTLTAVSLQTDDPSTAKKPDEVHYFYDDAAIMGTIFLTLSASIFFYNRRKTQIMLCWVATLLMLVALVLIYLKTQVTMREAIDRTLGYGAFGLSLCIIFTLMARRGIQKDDALVKSADRLR